MRKRICLCAALVVGATALMIVSSATSAGPRIPYLPAKTTKPRVEVVFCLDTTGSMGGLIEGAKQKIWSLCNQIAGGKPTPELKVGLVAYRDRGDQYVTKVFDLTDDLDAIHGHLMGFQADGGGDEPESVNEALHVALNKIQWSEDKGVLRIIYLVGDAPPHMDYANDIAYTTTCREACKREIIINTIQCGNIQSTTPVWREIAQKSEGRFVQIAQDGGVQTVSTPFDGRLAEINGKLAQTALAWGSPDIRCEAVAKMNVYAMPAAATGGIRGAGTEFRATECATASTTFGSTVGRPLAAGGLSHLSFTAGMPCSTAAPAACTAPPCAPAGVFAAAADRAGYCAKTGKVAALDLVDGIKEGKVTLEDLKTDQLPDEMQKMTLAERKEYLAKVERDRAKLRAEALELDRQRSDFINQELRRRGAANGFDDQVMDMLRDQARKHHIAY